MATNYTPGTTASGVNATMQNDPSVLNVLQNKENSSEAGQSGIAREIAGYQIVDNGTGGDKVSGGGPVMLVYYRNPDGSISTNFQEQRFDTINEGRNDNPAVAPKGGYLSDTEYNKQWDAHYGGGTSGTPGGGAAGGGAAGGSASLGPGGIPAGLSGDQRNAYVALTNTLNQYGLGSLAGSVLGFIQQGYDQTTVGFLLQNTPEYKQRFAGNELRRQAGLSVLSPAEYLATERAYKQAASAYGLPKDFYDNPSDFSQLIGKDISPQEFSTRASYAFKYAQNGNPESRALLQQYYGIDDRHLAAYFLDPQRAQAILDRTATAVDIGTAGLRQGIGVTKDLAENYADQGVTEGQAKQGFANAADVLQSGQLDIAQRFGSDLSATDVANEFVTGLASAKRKRDLLNQQETSLFRGDGGAAARSYGSDNFGSY